MGGWIDVVMVRATDEMDATLRQWDSAVAVAVAVVAVSSQWQAGLQVHIPTAWDTTVVPPTH